MLTEAIKNTEDDDESRTQAAVGLGKIGTPTAIDTLLLALDDADLKLRSAASASLARAGRPVADQAPVNMVLTKCISALQSSSEVVKIGVAQALQGIAAPEANASLLAIANNKQASENLRSTALASVGFVGNTGVVGALVSLLAEQDTEKVGNAALTALSKIGTQAVASLLATFTKGDDTASYRAAMALAKMGAGILPRLQTAAQDKNPNVQRWAAVALGEMGVAEAVPVLNQLKGSADADVAHVAKEQLYRYGQLQ
jgi:HEAT repeat protein